MKPHEKKQEKFIILINFKRVTGDRAHYLAMELDKIDNSFRELFDIIIALQPMDALRVAGDISLPLFIQDGCIGSSDLFLEGIDTGIIPQGKLRGVILSHPEKKLPRHILAERFFAVRKLRLEIMLCATSLDEGIDLNHHFQPKYLAVENEQLIGKDISICDYCPEMVTEVVQRIDNRILFGGGIRTPGDIHFILKKGGSGVLISSLVIKSPDPLTALKKLLNPLNYID